MSMFDSSAPIWSDEIRSNRVVLDMKRVGATVQESLEFSTTREADPRIGERLIHKVTGYVLSARVNSNEVTVTVPYQWKVPASWWDAFKAEQVEATSPLWRWVARRWPAQYITHEDSETRVVHFTRDAMFPHADIAIPRGGRLGQPVMFEWTEVERGRA